MTIATNNGVPIIRDGKVVTDCGCCVSWLCCPDPACLRFIATLYVTIEPIGATPIPVTPYVGTFAVPFVGVEASGRLSQRLLRWTYRFPVSESCVDARIEFEARHAAWVNDPLNPQGDPGVGWEMNIFVNSRHFAEGDTSLCSSVRLRYPPQGIGAFTGGAFWCGQPGYGNGYGTGFFDSSLLGRSFRVRIEFVAN